MAGERTAMTVAGILAVATTTVIAWWAWLGHDTSYQTDPVTGVVSGPYEAYQVIGCGLTLIVIVFGAAWYLRPWPVAIAATVSFTAAWSWQASGDDTGLWIVGAFLVVIGMTSGSIAVAMVAAALRARLRRWTAPAAQR